MKNLSMLFTILLSLNLCYGQYYHSINISKTNDNSNHSHLLINSNDEKFLFWVENDSTIFYKHTLNGYWSSPILTHSSTSRIMELSANSIQDTCHIFFIEQNDTLSLLKHCSIFNKNISSVDTLYKSSRDLIRLESANSQNDIHIGLYQEKSNQYSYYDIVIFDYFNSNYCIVDSSYDHFDYTIGYDSNSTLWLFWFGYDGICSRHLINENTWSDRINIQIGVPFCKDINCCFNHKSQLFGLSLAGDIATADTFENGLFFVEGFNEQWSTTETIIEQTSFTGRTRYSEYPQILVNSIGDYKIYFEDDYSDYTSSYSSISIAEKDNQNNWITYNVLPSNDQTLNSLTISSEDTIYITYMDDEDVFVAYEDNPLEIFNTKNVNIPNLYHVENNYPNPFNGSTRIVYYSKLPSKVSIRIYNSIGQLVANNVLQKESKGRSAFNWYPKSTVPTGVYYYILTFNSPQGSETLRNNMLYIK